MKISSLTKYLLYQLYRARLLIGDVGPQKPESLHQLRVALRRVRSLTKLYCPDSLPFPKPLKNLLKTTNSLRELDVLILSIDPESHKRVRLKLAEICAEEYRLGFNEAFQKELAAALDDFYDTVASLNPDPLGDTLIEKAQEHYHESILRYEALPPDASRKVIHALRIRFKISRYALEFLHESGLKNEKEKLLECKHYQNRFGEIQDLYNQIRWLKRFYKEHPIHRLGKLLKERKKMLKKLKETSR